jgi:hypothetical protein
VAQLEVFYKMIIFPQGGSLASDDLYLLDLRQGDGI